MNVRELAARIPTTPGISPSGPAPAPASPSGAPGSREARAAAFSEALEQATMPGVTLSAHARQRIDQRGISFGEAEQRSLYEALQALSQKGARDALLVGQQAAFVVNVPNKTVVTAMDPAEAQTRIFTKIDSAMLI